MTQQPDAPAWFSRALAATPEHRDVDVDGARVHYRAWGRRGLPGLVLVHGGAAPSGWGGHVPSPLSPHPGGAIHLTGPRGRDPPEGFELAPGGGGGGPGAPPAGP